jgi:hypothetical protein
MTSFSMRRSRIAFVGAAFASDLRKGVSTVPNIAQRYRSPFLKMLDVLSRRRCRQSSKSHKAQWLATVQLVNGNLRVFQPRSNRNLNLTAAD